MKPECKIDGCVKPAKGRGWCAMHWTRWRRHGDPLVALVEIQKDTCQVSGCDREPHRLSLCHGHLKRFREHGTVAAEVPLDAGGKAFREWLAARDAPPPPETCCDCGGVPMPGGALRCVDCFYVWLNAKDHQRRAGWTGRPDPTRVAVKSGRVVVSDRMRGAA